ncbi:MAG: non-canonical purine NTP pyrophosphatase [Candidatus Paceibacterota bacterium]
MQKLTFITGNEMKAKQLSDHFHFPVDHMKLDLPEIQSLDVEEVVIDKARRAYAIVKSPVLVEDVSFTLNALGSLPGPLIKWFLQSMGNSELCKLLDGHEDRSATAEVCFGFCDGDKVHVFKGTRKGVVTKSPRGVAGFGFDPIFIPEGFTKTWGEMNEEEGRESSMRRLALEKLSVFLADYNK